MAAERAELTPLAASPTPPSCTRTRLWGRAPLMERLSFNVRGFLGYPCPGFQRPSSLGGGVTCDPAKPPRKPR